jgi:hypothetical protein
MWDFGPYKFSEDILNVKWKLRQIYTAKKKKYTEYFNEVIAEKLKKQHQNSIGK